MYRGVAKGAVLFGFGRAPGGARLYRELTRNWMGTQATHVDKLQRVWPGYVELWRHRCGLRLERADIWVHEAGWTPFAPLVNYLVTGNGGVITNSEGRVLDRYLARAVNGALATDLPADAVPESRRSCVERMRWYASAEQAVEEVGGAMLQVVGRGAIPLASDSIDLCHSGGALEHYRPDELRRFLAECFRVVRSGGIASHVLDHRDHLYHADKRMPFLAHLAVPDLIYRPFLAHPLGYHNRLLPCKVDAMFVEAGFQRLAIRRMLLPEHRYVEDDNCAMSGSPGLNRKWLRRRFRSASDADLRTAAAHYLFRKPH